MTDADAPVPAAIPAWLEPLAMAARTVRAIELSRFVPPPEGGRASAVLILFGSDERGPNVVITERSHGLRHHPGQPSFPGGRIDPDDDGPVEAALREATEETGLDASGVVVLATLPAVFLPVNSSVVTPVIGWWWRPSPIGVVDPVEVASVHVVPLAQLTDPAGRLRIRHPSGFVGPAFEASGLLIWGFTAGLLDRVLHLGGWERPWDERRLEDLPPDALALSARDAEPAGAPWTTARS